MPQLTSVAFIRARAGHADELGRRLDALVEPSRRETGCVRYDVHRSRDDPDLWFVYENWDSAEDFDAHFNTPHLRAFLAALPATAEGELDLHAFTMISVPAPPGGR